MRRKLLLAAAIVHLVIAALFSTHVRVENFLPWEISRPLQLYGGYTGAATRFNFFAPAVPTQLRVQFLLTGRDGKARAVDLRTASNDANQRLANMLAIYELVALRALVVRSWGIFMLSQFADAQSVEVRVEILDIPTIAQARMGRAASWVESERVVVRRDEIS